MSRFDRIPDVSVPIGPCDCPGQPHSDGDVVYLAPVLSAPGGMAAQGAIADAYDDSPRLQELLWRIYRDHGIVGWNFLDEDGDPVPLTVENKERFLSYGKGGELVGNAADELYKEDVLRPFLARLKLLEKLQQDERRARRSKAGSTSTSRLEISAIPTSTKPRRSRSSTSATEPAPRDE